MARKGRKSCTPEGHTWVFSMLWSYENGSGEVYVCPKCGKVKGKRKESEDDLS